MRKEPEKTFYEVYEQAKEFIAESNYREAFDIIVDVKASSVKELFNKIGILIDIGFIQREEKILQYGIYLLETQKDEIVINPDYAPLVYFNLANQYNNMAALYSMHDDFDQYYKRAELIKAKEYYLKTLDCSNLTNDVQQMIYKNLGFVYMNLGRGWSALEYFQKVLEKNGKVLDVLNCKAELLMKYASLNPKHRKFILREAYHIVKKAIVLDEENVFSDDLEAKVERLKSLVEEGYLVKKGRFPSSTVEVDNDFELYYIKYCVKNKLYINACCFCGKCDCSIGDLAVIDTKNLTLSGKGSNRYYELAISLNKIKEEFVAGRYLLVLSTYDEIDLSFAEMNLTRANIEGYIPTTLKDSLAKKAFIIGWEMIAHVSYFLNLYLGNDMESVSSPDRIWLDQSGVKERVLEIKSPSLHALFDIYCELFSEGKTHLKETYSHLRKDKGESLPVLYSNPMGRTGENIEETTLELYGVLRDIILYMMMLVEEESDANRKIEINYNLYNFFIPKDLAIT